MLTRDVIKHLNAVREFTRNLLHLFCVQQLYVHRFQIEEQCLDSLAWKSSSPLWEQIDHYGDTLPERQQADTPVISDAEQHSAAGEKVSKQLFKVVKAPAEKVAPEPKTSDAADIASSSAALSGDDQSVIVKAKSRGGPLILFCRKFYKLAYLRILELCKHLNYLDKTYLQKIWTIFEYSITKQFHLMRDRHLDQILMCSIYVFGRNNKFETTFRDIMTSYRKLPQATSAVYRDVHMTKTGEYFGNYLVELYLWAKEAIFEIIFGKLVIKAKNSVVYLA